MTYNTAPLQIVSPDGTLYAPVRVLVVEGKLQVEDRDGNVLATDSDATVTGTRIVTIDAAGGRWSARTLCNCSRQQRAWKAEWFGT